MKLQETIRYLLQEGLSPEQLAKAEKKLGLKPSEIVKEVTEADPTPNQQYDTWILKQWIFQNVRLPEDSPRVRESLQHFEELKRKPSSQVQRDIFRYRTIADLEQDLIKERPELAATRSEVGGKIAGMPGVEVYKVNGPYVVLKVTNEQSLKELGEGTKWCTRGSFGSGTYANHYLKQHGYLYIILKEGKPFIQLTPDFSQVMDVNDHRVDDTSLLTEFFPPDEKMGPQEALGYVTRVANYAKVPQLEKAIASDPKTAIAYARRVVKGRWPEGEKAIAKDSDSAFEYAVEVLRKKFPAGEKAIAKNAKMSLEYAIKTEGPFPSAEKKIAANPQTSYYYARKALKGPFPAGEAAIATKAQWSFLYATHVKGAFPEGEPAMKEVPSIWDAYQREVLGK